MTELLTYLTKSGTLPPRMFKQKDLLLAYCFAFVFGAGFFAIIFYLAIYFQSVLGSSATKAGIQLLPLLISTVLSSIVTGGLITAIGYYVPIMIFCMALYSIGAGLLTTLTRTTPFGKWFGYQVLAGAGIGELSSTSSFRDPTTNSYLQVLVSNLLSSSYRQYSL